MWYLDPIGRAQLSAGLDIHRHNVLRRGREVDLKRVHEDHNQATRHHNDTAILPQEPVADL